MTTRPGMAVDIGGIKMKNPVMVASGTFGYGREYADVLDIGKLGAVVVKGISLEPHGGNSPPRLVEVPGGLVNAIGLQNPGADSFISDYLPFLRDFDTPVIVNVWGKTIEEYEQVIAKLDDVDGIAGLELNISCPNIKEGGIAFGTDAKMAAKVISACRKKTKLPLMPKLSPNVSDIATFALVAEENGADAISLINSLPAMVIDVETRRPALSNVTGGLTGPAIRPVAVKLVWQAAQAVGIPIVGMGGITGASDAIEFILAGAQAVAVGTANFSDPQTSLSVIAGIEEYLSRAGFATVQDAVGALQI